VNFAVAESRGEIIIVIDTDSSVEANTIWEMVQPFADPRVGAVGGTLRVRNARRCLVTMCQAYEYLHAIFLGRQVAARLGIMQVASGALGAFRRSAVERCGGWDVGPGEDGDLTIKVRKLGYKAVFAPYAVAHTDVPETWRGLFRQRRRWNRGLVRYKCRKHVDMANPLSANFRWGNFFLLLNVWFFKIGLLLLFWVQLLKTIVLWGADTGYALLTTYVTYQCFHLMQVVVLMYYSDRRWRDLCACVVVPLTPVYRTWLAVARLVSITEETLWRRSYEDNYVPPKVRAATIRW
jgi:cellulose synthase/poly-beta-1,6-N-acetylglucosamine synthase-like glycosyltransferase